MQGGSGSSLFRSRVEAETGRPRLPNRVYHPWSSEGKRHLLDLRLHQGVHRHQRELPHMIVRLLLLLLLAAAPLRGDPEQDITEVVSTLAAALSANNPPAFLKAIDHASPVYPQLEHDVTALATDTLIECSIELI